MRSESPDMSSSSPALRPKQRREILALGDALVIALGLEQSNDILGRWMAHRLARLIETAKTAPPASRDAAEQACFDAVLEVWRHRTCLPQGSRPFEPAERLLDTIVALDPDAPRSVYPRVEFEWDGLDKAERPTPAERKRLDVVRQFDRVARTVILHLLTRVAEDLPGDTRAWVAQAKAAGLDGYDISVIRILLERANHFKDLGDQVQDQRIDKLRSRLEDMEQFGNVMHKVQTELADELAAAEAERASARGPAKARKRRR